MSGTIPAIDWWGWGNPWKFLVRTTRPQIEKWSHNTLRWNSSSPIKVFSLISYLLMVDSCNDTFNILYYAVSDEGPINEQWLAKDFEGRIHGIIQSVTHVMHLG